MSFTTYHARALADETTKRSSSVSIDSLTHPSERAGRLESHQVETIPFSFRCLLSSGASLADQIGPGKTIETEILLSQRWPEHLPRLVIFPINLSLRWVETRRDAQIAELETRLTNGKNKNHCFAFVGA